MNITEAEAMDIADGIGAVLHPVYSGRSMFGRVCVGFSGDFNDVELGVVLADRLGDGVAFELAGLARSDSLGRGRITYFPSVTVEDEGL